MKDMIKKFWLNHKVLIIAVLISTVLVIFLIDTYQDPKHDIEYIRNLGLVITALLGFPFLVWRSDIADKAYKQSVASHYTDMLIKATEQLASEKETIRLAGTISLIQILKQSQDNADTKTTDHIFDILSCFIFEHSRDAIEAEKRNDKLECLKISKFYSQFRFILPIVSKKDNKKWWSLMLSEKIYLKGAGLQDLNLSFSMFHNANLSHANLFYTNFNNSEFFYIDFEKANLRNTQFLNADLTRVQNLEKAKSLEHATYNNKTKFPKDFNPKEHHMINVDEANDETLSNTNSNKAKPIKFYATSSVK